MCGTSYSSRLEPGPDPDHRDWDQKLNFAGTIIKLYRGRDRDHWKNVTEIVTQIKPDFTGIGTGTIEKKNWLELTGNGTGKTWSRTSLLQPQILWAKLHWKIL
jgi:hypothetical protein